MDRRDEAIEMCSSVTAQARLLWLHLCFKLQVAHMMLLNGEYFISRFPKSI